MAMTWTTLQADLGTYTANQSATFIAKQPTFIELAESRIRRDLYVPEQVKHTAAGVTFTATDPLLTLPEDFVRFDSLFYEESTNNYLPVEFVKYAILQLYWPTRTDTDSEIKYYSRYSDTQLIVAPTPATAIKYRMSYVAYEPKLSGSVLTNWITDNAPDAFLAAALIEAFKFQRNAIAVAEWETHYAGAAQRVNAETKVAERRDDVGGPAQMNSGRSG